MSKKLKVIISATLVVLLVGLGGATAVVAQGDEEPAPEAAGGVLDRVAEKLGVTKEELIDAFKQARREIREERVEQTFLNAVDRALEQRLIDDDEAAELREWWEQRPEALEQILSLRCFGYPALRGLCPQDGTGWHGIFGIWDDDGGWYGHFFSSVLDDGHMWQNREREHGPKPPRLVE